MTNHASLPSIHAALGATLEALKSQSSYPLKLDAIQDYDFVGVTAPVQFNFAGPGAFSLPPTRFVSLDSVATLVVGIESSPQLEYLSQPEALSLFDEISQRAEAAGWVPLKDDPKVTEREELLLRLRDPALPETYHWFLASYSHGTARLLFDLRRVHRAGRMADHDLFLLNLIWRDEALFKSAEQISATLRREDGVPWDTPRRIDLATYTRRVLALRSP